MSENDTKDSQDSQGSPDNSELGISDDQLPADVRPDEDNPLARHPEQTGEGDDEIGADREGDPETAPLTEEDGDYSEGGSGDASS